MWRLPITRLHGLPEVCVDGGVGCMGRGPWEENKRGQDAGKGLLELILGRNVYIGRTQMWYLNVFMQSYNALL